LPPYQFARDTNDIGGDPVHRRAKARETAMDHHEISRMVKNLKPIEKAWFPVSQFSPTAGF
jgi:hypothetical protein